VIATPEHRAGLEARLAAGGLDLSAARARAEYIALDAAETLSRIMLAGAPEPGRFAEVVGGVIAQAEQGGRHVRAFGEMVALLWAEGNAAAAIRLEELWNDLRDATATPFSLCCGYPMQGFASEANGAPFADICARHSHVIPAEGYSALVSADERLRAITLLQQKAAALEAEIDERKQLEARKNAFISMASHELKTPVTSLKGFTQILQRRLRQQQADPQTLLFLDRMDAQLKKLTNLIGDLLDLSRMQTGNLVFRESSFDFDELVRETVENVQAATTTHHLRVEGKTRAALVGDRDRLEQVLVNLLTNAIKYSPQADSVLISLSGDDERVEVAVRDFGIGIAEAHHERIFERFYQVSDQHENTYPGLGIGLHIARTIVERHSGRLWLESREGSGSTFHVRLPRQGLNHDGSPPTAS
jgi:signal transduction histidine kinase